jgi:regulation of enolase protein 1 (concanavalin A-like superfamily)
MTRTFARLVRAELTKLLTVPRWLLGLAAMSLLTVGFGLLTASTSRNDANEHRDFVVGPDGTAVSDDLYFVHRTVTGDATVTVQVTDQDPSHPRAQAGLLLKQGTTSGARYVSVAVTPGHGVRFDTDFGAATREVAGTAPGWLRLTRLGTEVRAATSDDGTDWQPVGVTDLAGVGDELEVGMFVSSPDDVVVERDASSTMVGTVPTFGRATFAHLTLDPVPSGSGGGWHGDAITGPSPGVAAGPAPAPSEGKEPPGPDRGGVTEADGRYTITGSGDIGPAEPPDDSVQASLFGAVFGLMALAAVAVLFVTSEHKRHLVWTTFAASPHRRQVLAAKAVVIGAASFALGLATATVTYLAAQPMLRSRGFTRPAFAPTSLTQPGVARAVVGTALLLTAFALLGLGLGSLLRRSSGAIAAVFSLGIVPLFVTLVVPISAPWLLWLTPAGGFAVQRSKPPTDELAEPWSQMNPWAGLAVAVAYAVVALAAAAWAVERRDA